MATIEVTLEKPGWAHVNITDVSGIGNTGNLLPVGAAVGDQVLYELLDGSGGAVTVGPNGVYSAGDTFNFRVYDDSALSWGSLIVAPVVGSTVTVTGNAVSDPATTTGQVIGTSTGVIPTASVILTDDFDVPLPNLTGLKWAWYDERTPDLFNAPTDQGIGEVTDNTGLFEVQVPNSALAVGQVGWLVVTDSDGIVATDHKAFSGPRELT